MRMTLSVWRQNLLRLALLAITAFVVGGSLATSEAPAASKTDTVILASGLGPPYMWYMTAVEKGIMKKYGVNAEYKIFPSGVEAIVAVGAGEAHVSNGSCSTVMRARANGSRFLVVARNIINPSEHKLISLADIKKPDDLKGKSVGMLAGSSTDWYASKYFSAFGLKQGSDADSVNLVSIQAPEWVPALERKDIVAFFGWEPWVSKALQIVSGAHVLNNGGDNGLFVLMNCMVFNEDWVKNDPESAIATMKAIIETHDVVEADKKAAADLASSKMRVPAEDLFQQSQCCTFKVDFTPEFVAHAKEAAEWAQSKGMLKQGDAKSVFDQVMYPDLLRTAMPERVTVH